MDDSEDEEDMIFMKAREFLQLVRRTTKAHTCAEVNVLPPAHVVNIQLNKTIEKRPKCETQWRDFKEKKVELEMGKGHELTTRKRRKLERIKTPVTSFVKQPEKSTVVQNVAEDESVNKMLVHLSKLPEQDAYSPPSIPMGVIRKRDEEDDISVINDASPEVQSQQFIYLTSDKDLAAWKMLNKSLTKRNVFVGNLSYKVDQFVLRSLFETLVINEQRHLMRVRLVMDNLSGVSKGYGFVEFPYRRAAELAIICLQGFELYGREIQLGWGQDNEGEEKQHLVQNSTFMTGSIAGGAIVLTGAKDSEIGTCKRKKRTRWDVEQREELSAEIPLCNGANISHSRVSGVKNKISLSQRERHLQLSTVHKKAAMEWLTKKQRVNLIKTVCKNLRMKNVTGHLGVFSEYFEADNSRLQVTCSRDLNEEELKSIFAQFGTMRVTCFKLEECETRVNIQYATSVSAENALKQLHGKIVKNRPLSVTIAEPIR